MIRREIQLPGESPQWLLTEQLEHARVSAKLAERCIVHLGQTTMTGRTISQSVRDELLSAIYHHDDGWAAWDAQPQFDPEQRRPLSFRELRLHDSLSIWNVSIEAAASIGPLAAWVVSGHFLALLRAGDKPIPQLANDWQHAMIARRIAWLASWQALSPEINTQGLADEALLWLQLLDVMSLWLCSTCPGQGEQVPDAPHNYRVGIGQPLETEFDLQQGYVRIHPWRFDVSSLQLIADAWVVPIRAYSSVEELLAARVAHSVRWQLAFAGFAGN